LRIKQRADDDDRGTILVLPTDPFQSLTTARVQNGATVDRRRPATQRAVETRTQTCTRRNLGPEYLKPPVSSMRIASAISGAQGGGARSCDEAAEQPAAERDYSRFMPSASRKGSARDAWCAVALMGMFITGGIVWTNNRINNDEAVITDLRTQLADANAAVEHKAQELKVLYERANDAESELAKVRAAAGVRVARR
jgi:hypothetical protein